MHFQRRWITPQALTPVLEETQQQNPNRRLNYLALRLPATHRTSPPSRTRPPSPPRPNPSLSSRVRRNLAFARGTHTHSTPRLTSAHLYNAQSDPHPFAICPTWPPPPRRRSPCPPSSTSSSTSCLSRAGRAGWGRWRRRGLCRMGRGF